MLDQPIVDKISGVAQVHDFLIRSSSVGTGEVSQLVGNNAIISSTPKRSCMVYDPASEQSVKFYTVCSRSAMICRRKQHTTLNFMQPQQFSTNSIYSKTNAISGLVTKKTKIKLMRDL